MFRGFQDTPFNKAQFMGFQHTATTPLGKGFEDTYYREQFSGLPLENMQQASTGVAPSLYASSSTTNVNIPGAPFFNTYGTFAAGTKYVKSVLGANGKIYGLPVGSGITQIPEFDPVTKEISFFGSFTGAGNKTFSGVLAPNGKIYCSSGATTSILVIDVNNRTTYEIDTSAFPFGSNSYPLVLPNGKIYFMPGNIDGILILDPKDDSLSIPPTYQFTTGDNFGGAVLGPNGKVYGIPSTNNISSLWTAYEYDYVTDTAIFYNTISTTTIDAWRGAVLAPNGKIYGIPYRYSGVCEIDPNSKTWSIPITWPTNTARWWGGVLGLDNRIYATPYGSTNYKNLLSINFEETSAVFSNSSPLTAQYAGGVLAPNGKIYAFPYTATTILEIDIGRGFVSEDVYTMPTDLSQLPTSAYNMYHNKF